MGSLAHRDCYIVGCGRSLLRLTPDEVARINACDCVLTFNKYPLFHEKVGIHPTHYLLGDTSEKADVSLRGTLDEIASGRLTPMQLLLRDVYRFKGPTRWGFAVRALSRALRGRGGKGHYRMARYAVLRDLHRRVCESGLPVRYFRRRKSVHQGHWAEHWGEPLFHYRATLADAINAAYLLCPGRTVKLLGVDLGEHAYFFQEELEADPKRWRVFLNREAPDASSHVTSLTLKGSAGIQTRFPMMQERVATRGGRIVCCNPDSLLVRENWAPWAPV